MTYAHMTLPKICQFLARLDKVQEEHSCITTSVSISIHIYIVIDLVHIWYDDRCSSKVLFSNTLAHYLKVKVMDLESLNVKVF